MTVEDKKTNFAEKIAGTTFVVNAMFSKDATYLVKALIAREVMSLDPNETQKFSSSTKIYERIKNLSNLFDRIAKKHGEISAKHCGRHCVRLPQTACRGKKHDIM